MMSYKLHYYKYNLGMKYRQELITSKVIAKIHSFFSRGGDHPMTCLGRGKRK